MFFAISEIENMRYREISGYESLGLSVFNLINAETLNVFNML